MTLSKTIVVSHASFAGVVNSCLLDRQVVGFLYVHTSNIKAHFMSMGFTVASL